MLTGDFGNIPIITVFLDDPEPSDEPFDPTEIDQPVKQFMIPQEKDQEFIIYSLGYLLFSKRMYVFDGEVREGYVESLLRGCETITDELLSAGMIGMVFRKPNDPTHRTIWETYPSRTSDTSLLQKLVEEKLSGSFKIINPPCPFPNLAK